jgi:hypothetical protein
MLAIGSEGDAGVISPLAGEFLGRLGSDFNILAGAKRRLSVRNRK